MIAYLTSGHEEPERAASGMRQGLRSDCFHRHAAELGLSAAKGAFGHAVLCYDQSTDRSLDA